ncbi:hypothetical protein PV325_011115 [Microctonus aethiopoides]|nr:hypothetical protein PV325_011115 [Microctonus aethiopoides]
MRGFEDFPPSQIDVSTDPYLITNSDSNKELSNDDNSDSEDDEREYMDDNEDYEILTVSEAPNDDNRYDDQMDIYIKICSEHTNGSKHKYARGFYQPNDHTVVASMHAPITFPSCRVMCYKQQNYGIMVKY